MDGEKIKTTQLVVGGVHLIDLIKFLTKKSLKRLFQGNNISTSSRGINFPDCISSIIKFKDDSIMNLVSNFGSISPHHHCLNIYGTKGTGIYQLTNQFFISKKNKNKLFVVDNVKNNKELILKNYIKNLISKKKMTKKKVS